MASHLQSGYYYPNKAARAMLELLESVLGRNGLHALLNLAQLPDLKDNFPPYNMDRQFDFANFSLINQALEEIYGRRGGHALAVRAGRGVFSAVLSNYGALAGVRDPAFQALPLDVRLKIGLAAIAVSCPRSVTSKTRWRWARTVLLLLFSVARIAGGAAVWTTRSVPWGWDCCRKV